MSRKTTIKLRWETWYTDQRCPITDSWQCFVHEIANDVEIAVYGPMHVAAAKEFRKHRQHLMEQAIMECALRELRQAADLKRIKERGLTCSGQSSGLSAIESYWR